MPVLYQKHVQSGRVIYLAGTMGDGTHVGGIVDAFEEVSFLRRVCVVTDTLTSSPLFMNYAAATAGHQFPF